jgi:hypothetical protein
MTKAKYALNKAGEIAKDGAAALGVAATYATPGMMPREWAEWSFDKLKGDGYFEKHEENIAAGSGSVEKGLGVFCMLSSIPVFAVTDDQALSWGLIGAGAYLLFEGDARGTSDEYKSNVPVSLVSRGVKAVRKAGNYFSDRRHDYAEKREGKEK